MLLKSQAPFPLESRESRRDSLQSPQILSCHQLESPFLLLPSPDFFLCLLRHPLTERQESVVCVSIKKKKKSGLMHGWTEMTTHALVSTIITYSRLLSSFINRHELLYSASYACSSRTLSSLFPPGGQIKDYNAHFKVHAHSKYLVHNTPSR